jgi:hypothetical protein
LAEVLHGFPVRRAGRVASGITVERPARDGLEGFGFRAGARVFFGVTRRSTPLARRRLRCRDRGLRAVVDDRRPRAAGDVVIDEIVEQENVHVGGDSSAFIEVGNDASDVQALRMVRAAQWPARARLSTTGAGRVLATRTDSWSPLREETS